MHSSLKSLTVGDYSTYLEQIYKNKVETGEKMYMCVNSEGKIHLLDASQNLHHRLQFRDIVLFAKKYENPLVNKKNNDQAFFSFKEMYIHKLMNEDEIHPIIHSALIIAECCKNFFQGYGFQTSSFLAKKLIEKWSANIQKSSPSAEFNIKEKNYLKENKNSDKVTNTFNMPTKIGIPPSTPNSPYKGPDLLVNKTNSPAVKSLTKKWEKNKEVVDFVSPKSSIDNPHFKDIGKNLIFLGLDKIERVIELMNKGTQDNNLKNHITFLLTSIEKIQSHSGNIPELEKTIDELMSHLNTISSDKDNSTRLIAFNDKLKEIVNHFHTNSHGKTEFKLDILKKSVHLEILNVFDLKTEVCSQLIIDIFKRAQIEVARDLVLLLSKLESFDLLLLKSCFEVYIEKEKKQGINFEELFILETLVKIYDQQYLSNPKAKQNPPILPVNHPSVISHFCILLGAKHNNDDNVRLYLSRLILMKEFDANAYMAFMSVFKQKEEEKHKSNLVYLAKNMLETHFNNTPALQKAVLDMENA